MTAPRNMRMANAVRKYGFWARTKTDPYRAVKWDPEVREDGKTRIQGRSWVEILPNGAEQEPQRFLGEDITLAPPTEPMDYAPREGEPVCGWQITVQAYCPRYVVPGQLCPPHKAAYEKYAAEDEGEDPS